MFIMNIECVSTASPRGEGKYANGIQVTPLFMDYGILSSSTCMNNLNVAAMYWLYCFGEI